MIKIDNVNILASVYEIMMELQRQLRLRGSPLLQTISKKYGIDIQFTCPYHKNGLENKPSCGITTREIKKGDKIVPAGVFHCFSCSAHGDIAELISHCFGREDGGLFGKKWLLEKFNNFEVENRSGFFKKLGAEEKVEVKYITEEELKKYRYVHPYMYKRYLTDELIDTYDIGYDSAFQLKSDLKPFPCITFPVKDEKGNVLFIARRSIYGKLFHYLKEVEKPIYGLWEARNLFPDSKELYICESILNALMLIKWGKPAVALLGTGTHEQLDRLKHFDYRKYMLCLDSDDAGERGTKKIYKNLSNCKLLQALNMPKGYDINDLGYCESYEEFLKEVERGNE